MLGRWAPANLQPWLYAVIAMFLAGLLAVNWPWLRSQLDKVLTRFRQKVPDASTFWLIALMLFPFGVLFGTIALSHLSLQKALGVGAVAVGSLFFFKRFYDAYLYFAGRFAETVYRDFFALHRWPPEAPQ
jgi:hypothetical protein